MEINEVIQNHLMDAINKWRNAKGVGSILIQKEIDDKVVLLCILTKMFEKKPQRTLIITEQSSDNNVIRKLINDATNNELANSISNNYLEIFSSNYLKEMIALTTYDFVVLYHVNTLTPLAKTIFQNAKFKLALLKNSTKDFKDIIIIAPTIPINRLDVKELRSSTPVEEMQYCITMSDTETRTEYNRLSDFIKTSLDIFGNFDVMELCRKGDNSRNLSYIQICNAIATEKGWNENLDLEDPFQRAINEKYNPSSIADRAYKVYEACRDRKNLLYEAIDKISAIADILIKNKDKKILILSKTGRMATMIAAYINEMKLGVAAAVHSKVPDIPAEDVCGNPIYYTTGSNKGKRKMFAEKAQYSLYSQRFELGLINVLSLSNSFPKDLKLNYDILIRTSPECKSHKEILYDFEGINSTTFAIHLFTLFIADTTENKALYGKTPDKNVKKCIQLFNSEQMNYNNTNNVNNSENTENEVNISQYYFEE